MLFFLKILYGGVMNCMYYLDKDSRYVTVKELYETNRFEEEAWALCMTAILAGITSQMTNIPPVRDESGHMIRYAQPRTCLAGPQPGIQ